MARAESRHIPLLYEHVAHTGMKLPIMWPGAHGSQGQRSARALDSESLNRYSATPHPDALCHTHTLRYAPPRTVYVSTAATPHRKGGQDLPLRICPARRDASICTGALQKSPGNICYVPPSPGTPRTRFRPCAKAAHIPEG